MTVVKASTGNRCGHDPHRPRLRLHRRPSHKFLSTTADRIRAYYTRPGVLPELGHRRSERREALILVLCALVHYTDLRTLRVIVSPSVTDKVQGVARRKLRTLTGLRYRRIDRALADLVEAGLLFFDGQPVEEIAPAKYIGYAAHRRFPVTLWDRLGLNVSLEIERKRAGQRHREAVQRRRADEAKAARRQLAPAARRVLEGFPHATVVEDEQLPPDLRVRLLTAQAGLRAEDPNLTAEEVRRRARVLLGLPPS